ncbi:hypothetical protein [Lewinella sp. 4G2]|uniref:hypothetical protein n=1 Tax=Lewinella sp. 4G2 TaxID=1803372 RepID=UPI0007B4E2D1|nr:hypothetical protein [Lewinella sp. 4G2]OAV43819.1 hypothetical protein A3850_004590 [Lewinella sp. 4G2]
MKNIPFSFVLDHLESLSPTVKALFGTHAIYAGNKIYLALRLKDKYPEDNGIWVGTEVAHHASLRAEFPALTPLNSIGIKKWLLLSDQAEDFEEVAYQLCLCILGEDERIGVVPKARKGRSSITRK